MWRAQCVISRSVGMKIYIRYYGDFLTLAFFFLGAGGSNSAQIWGLVWCVCTVYSVHCTLYIIHCTLPLLLPIPCIQTCTSLPEVGVNGLLFESDGVLALCRFN